MTITVATTTPYPVRSHVAMVFMSDPSTATYKAKSVTAPLASLAMPIQPAIVAVSVFARQAISQTLPLPTVH
jgi:hypothetical protein